MSKATELIKEYFCVGGLFNAELMEHEKVRDMIALAQEELTAAQAEIARLRGELEFYANPKSWLVAAYCYDCDTIDRSDVGHIEGYVNEHGGKRARKALNKGEL